jgi:hypothetical protein
MSISRMRRVQLVPSCKPHPLVGGVIDGGQYLFELGDPVEVLWFCHGRKATREEVLKSIESGYPLLLELAQQDGAEGVKALEEARDRALELIPQT